MTVVLLCLYQMRELPTEGGSSLSGPYIRSNEYFLSFSLSFFSKRVVGPIYGKLPTAHQHTNTPTHTHISVGIG